MKSTSNTKPYKFTFERYPRGGYILWLRENFHKIEKEEPDSQDSWVYDEYTILIPQYLTNNFIEQHFDEYITEARIKEASNAELRLSNVEDAVNDLAKLVGGMLDG